MPDPSVLSGTHAKSCYYGKMVPGHSDDWVFDQDADGRITRVGKGGDDCYNMCGISFFLKDDAKKIADAVVARYEKTGYEELFWDERKHEIYSNKFSHLITTDRELQGTSFRSDERMTKYFVSSSKGSFKKDDIDDSEKKKSSTTKKDSTTSIGRQPASPRRKVKTIPLTRQE
jgi:hypothetical protein